MKHLDLTVEQLIFIIEDSARTVGYDEAEQNMKKLDEIVEFVKIITK